MILRSAVAIVRSPKYPDLHNGRRRLSSLHLLSELLELSQHDTATMISGALDEQVPTEPVRFFKGGPGHQLGRDGRYELRAKLGAGISASVWLARDRETSW